MRASLLTVFVALVALIGCTTETGKPVAISDPAPVPVANPDAGAQVSESLPEIRYYVLSEG